MVIINFPLAKHSTDHRELPIMTEPARPAPFFIADDCALDFLNSIAAPWGREFEWLGNGEDLLAWLELAELVPVSVGKQFRKKVGREELDAVAAQTRKLREWFRTFILDHAGQPLQSTALGQLGTLNRLLAGDHSYRQIEVGNVSEEDSDMTHPALRWRQDRRWRSLPPNALLIPLAEAMGDLICRPDFEGVKICENPKCTLWFYDISKNHTRRWCSMAVCGNRAKAAAHRARMRAASS